MNKIIKKQKMNKIIKKIISIVSILIIFTSTTYYFFRANTPSNTQTKTLWSKKIEDHNIKNLTYSNSQGYKIQNPSRDFFVKKSTIEKELNKISKKDIKIGVLSSNLAELSLEIGIPIRALSNFPSKHKVLTSARQATPNNKKFKCLIRGAEKPSLVYLTKKQANVLSDDIDKNTGCYNVAQNGGKLEFTNNKAAEIKEVKIIYKKLENHEKYYNFGHNSSITAESIQKTGVNVIIYDSKLENYYPNLRKELEKTKVLFFDLSLSTIDDYIMFLETFGKKYGDPTKLLSKYANLYNTSTEVNTYYGKKLYSTGNKKYRKTAFVHFSDDKAYIFNHDTLAGNILDLAGYKYPNKGEQKEKVRLMDIEDLKKQNFELIIYTYDSTIKWSEYMIKHKLNKSENTLYINGGTSIFELRPDFLNSFKKIIKNIYSL